MSTTLIEEMEQAADALDAYAATLGAASCTEGYLDMRKDAARLRQRAAWVRELEAIKLPLTTAPALGSEWHTLGQQDMWAKLTGPIPAAETATTERTP